MEDGGLALVCASLGKIQRDENGKERYVTSPDCLEQLKDLQRYLRRDNPLNRDVFHQLGKWKIVRQDLVPILKLYSDNFDLVLGCVKVMVFLTMPIDPASHQVAIQGEYLQEFTAAIVEGDAFAVMVSLLEEPLQHLESESVTDEDWRMFQLFLTLLRNLLSASNSSPEQGLPGSVVLNLRDQLLDRLFSESAMELVVALGQHVAEQGLKKDNLLLLEIIQQVFAGQRADAVASASASKEKSTRQAVRSAENLRSFLDSEKEQLRRLRLAETQYTGMFMQIGRDGTKTVSTRNLNQSPLDSLARKPQTTRGPVKRIAQEIHPIFQSSDRICGLLKEFADQFLATGYNILMQSVKADIRRERTGLEDSDIVTFLQVSQFFTSYRCYIVQMDQHTRKKRGSGGAVDGTENEPELQKHLCGLIASTMDEETFNLVLGRWRDFAEASLTSKDFGPMGVAGRTMKDLIRMLDLIMKAPGPHTKEGQQEQRTARILLYKLFYDQTEHGILSFLNSMIRSFDIYKQHRSQLIDLVEITHIVLRLLENLEKSGEELRVLKKVRGKPKKKRTKPDGSKDEASPGEQAGDDAAALQKDVATGEQAGADAAAPQQDVATGEQVGDDAAAPQHDVATGEQVGDDAAPPQHVVTAGEQVNGTDASVPGMADPHNAAQEASTDGENQQGEIARNSEQLRTEEIPVPSNEEHIEEEEERDGFRTSDARESDADDDDDSSDREEQRNTTEVSFNIKSSLSMFANNVAVRNYCWLLKFYSSNGPSVNHYIVRFLQRVCEDCMLEPMLYQISFLQTFYTILSDGGMQSAPNQRFVMSFTRKLVGNLLKKLKSQPILFVDILFWKTRLDCHTIAIDYERQSLRRDNKENARAKPINIADALGDDEYWAVPGRESDNESNGSDSASSEIEREQAEGNAAVPAIDEERIRVLFERFKNEENLDKLIASELDPSGSLDAKRVRRRLRKLGLMQTPRNQSSMKSKSRAPAAEEMSGRTKSHSEKPQKERAARSKIFSKENDDHIKDLYSRYGSGKNVTKNITENLGGDFTTAQVSRRLRSLGLIKPKPKRAPDPLNANLTDVEEDTIDASKVGGSFPEDTALERLKKRRAAAARDSSDDDDLPLSRLLPGKAKASESLSKTSSLHHPGDESEELEPLFETHSVHQQRSEAGELGSQFHKYDTERVEMEDTAAIGTNLADSHLASPHVSRRLRRVNASKRNHEGIMLEDGPTDRNSSLEDDELELNKFDDLWDQPASPSKSDPQVSRKRRKGPIINISDSDDDVA